MAFNIFKVLEKDDKELIHSSFLKFLLPEDSIFAEALLGLKLPTINVRLENSHLLKFSKKRNKRFRFDIEIEYKNTVVVIENKFKSFPSKSQLKDYDKVLKQDYPDQNQIKILLCFDKNLFSGEDGWRVIDYGDLLPLIKQSKERISDVEKRIFIQHYIDLLSEYYETYKSLNNDLKEPFLKQSKKMSKFWVRLIYAKLKLRLEDYFLKEGIEVKIDFDKGSASNPLIDIIPKHWKVNNHQLLIQLQNNMIKFYAHTSDKEFLKTMIGKVEPHISHIKEFKIKPVTRRREKTAYICQLNINEMMDNSPTYAENDFYESLINFYHTFNEKVIERHKGEF